MQNHKNYPYYLKNTNTVLAQPELLIIEYDRSFIDSGYSLFTIFRNRSDTIDTMFNRKSLRNTMKYNDPFDIQKSILPIPEVHFSKKQFQMRW